MGESAMTQVLENKKRKKTCLYTWLTMVTLEDTTSFLNSQTTCLWPMPRRHVLNLPNL
ncbi:hypothetical protein HanPSC8_Chr01g0033141 [Helianthus annuus]|nr:hypothetical protein HanPSC8_Chr01g0033141 [Helianthus annuus]